MIYLVLVENEKSEPKWVVYGVFNNRGAAEDAARNFAIHNKQPDLWVYVTPIDSVVRVTTDTEKVDSGIRVATTATMVYHDKEKP